MPVVVTLVAVFGLALVLLLVSARLKLSTLVGYLAVDVIIGPNTSRFVADVSLAK
jgi:predicted Kef-type K+ transport protein